MAKKDGILSIKLFDNKTVEDMNRELYMDFKSVKDNVETLIDMGIKEMKDPQTIMLLLPNLKALIDTSLKNSANMNQLISINTKILNEKEESSDDVMTDVRKLMKERIVLNKTIAVLH